MLSSSPINHSHQIIEMPKDETKSKIPRRNHSRRTCQSCKKMKTRCELPNVEVEASELPLPTKFACHRCSTLKIDCIVSTPLKPLSARSLKRLAKLEAAEAERERDNSSGPSNHHPSVAGSSNLSTPQTASNSALPLDNNPSVIHSWAPTGNTEDSLESRLREEAAEKLLFNPFPLAILNDLVSRQRTFGSGLSENRFDQMRMDSICKLLSPHESSMERELVSILPWLPHLPSIATLRQEYEDTPTASSRLLLASIYLTSLPRSLPSKADIESSLRSVVKESLLPILMNGSNSNIRTIQALQFVSVYTPLTVSLDPDTNQPLLSGSLTHSAAVRLARNLGLDRSLEQLMSLSDIISVNNQEQLSQLAEGAIIWMSLCSWGLHFQASDRTDETFPSYSSNDDLFRPDWKQQSALLSPFFSTSSSNEEACHRMAGCIASDYRTEISKLYLETRSRLIQAGQIRAVRTRADELTRVLDSFASSSQSIRQVREADFASLSHGNVEVIKEWCLIEATSFGSLLTCSATARGTIECAIDFSHFYERMEALDIVGFVAEIGGHRRTGQSMEVLRQLVKMTSDRIRCPSRSTCAIGLFSSLHLMENLRLCIHTFGKKAKEHDSILQLLEQGVSQLSNMDSDLDLTLGSFFQATGAMFADMIRVIKGWEEKFVDGSCSAQQLKNIGYFEAEEAKQQFLAQQQLESHHHHQQQQQQQQQNPPQMQGYHSHQPPPQLFSNQEDQFLPPNPFPSFNSLPNMGNPADIDWWPFGGLMFAPQGDNQQ